MSLRRLATISLILVSASLLAFGLFGYQGWRDFHQQLGQIEQLKEVQAHLHDMTSAIDYVTLVRSDSSVVEALCDDARRLSARVAQFDHPQARLAQAHLLEIADMGDHLRTALPPAVLESNRERSRDPLLMLSRQIRVQHAGAREAMNIVITEANRAMLAKLYGGLRILTLATLALALLVLLAILAVHRRLLAPILALNAGLERISEGDLSARLSFERKDEFGNLARSFNHMAEQRQQFEDELADSETRFRQLAENIGEVFWVLDASCTQLLYVSPAFEALWHESAEALYEHPQLWQESIHPDDRERVTEALAHRPSGTYQAEYRVLRPDGSHRWVFDKSSPVYNDQGKIIRIVGVARDITERKAYQMSLAERIKELRCLYRVLELTASSHLTIDEIAEEVTGLLPGSLQHEHLAMARICIGDLDQASPNWRDPVVSIGSEITVDGQIAGAVEAAYVADTTGHPPQFLAEEHALINGVAIHIGRMIKNRRLNDTLTRSERMKAVGELTGGIAHDFNNLLTVILGNAELLEQELADSHPTQAGLASMISRAALRGADLTGRLLAFARRQALEPRPIDLNEQVSGMTDLLKRSLGGNIDLHFETADDLWPAMADLAQLESAILNLCLNARDAMPEGGRLTLETTNRVLDRSYAASQEEVEPGEYVMLAISDTGEGMEPEMLSRVFEPFFTTKDHGTGLGLSMVYGLVKQLRGHVRIYSEPGQGTTVRIYLPRADQNAAAILDDDQEVARLNGPETILLVEDNELVRSYARDQLKAMGYKVIEAADGPHALVVLRAREDIDLLFTDVIMPGGMTGPDLARLATELHPDLPVLFTSGYTENATLHQGRLDENAQLLSKPYRRVELGRRIRQILNSHLKR